MLCRWVHSDFLWGYHRPARLQWKLQEQSGGGSEEVGVGGTGFGQLHLRLLNNRNPERSTHESPDFI